MLVLDNSMLISALFEDEGHPVAQNICRMVLEGDEQALVPPVFLYEACNVVLRSLRRKRTDKETSKRYLEDVYNFPVQVDTRQIMRDVTALAIQHHMNMYDAAYLELSKRENLPLATLDGALAAAARKEKVLTLM